MRRLLTIVVVFALAVAFAVPASAGDDGLDHDDNRPTESEVSRDLAMLRKATAKFHRISVAEKLGYELGSGRDDIPITGCIVNPIDPEIGAMGYHWFDRDAIDDEVDPLRPEGLVYAPTENGKLRLVAVEWVVSKPAWDANNPEPPFVMGQELHELNPALGWYVLHAWIWKYNPSGVFADWNPNVDCSLELS